MGTAKEMLDNNVHVEMFLKFHISTSEISK